MAEKTQAKQRLSLRKSAVRSGPLAAREHGHEGEDDAVDQHGIQRVQRAHGHGERIGQAVGAEQVGGQRHAHETQNIGPSECRRR